MMSSSEDGISQTSRKRKHNRRRIWRFFRLPYRSNKSQYKHEEVDKQGGSSSEDGVPQNSSLSGDLSSLGASSRGDAITIGSMPYDNSALGAASINPAEGKSIKKFDMTDEPAQMDCPLCFNTQPAENLPRLSMCDHRSCMDCLRKYLTIEITESRVNLTCPECQEKIHPVDVRTILKDSPQLIEKWEEFMLRRCLSIDPDCRWCPAPDCGFAVIATGCAGCPKIHCERPGCDTYFCYHCRQEWHPDQTCDSAHLTRTKLPRLRSSSISFSRQTSLQEIKPCPKCAAPISKMNDGSCNHITCAVCGADFCWLCLQEITEFHYISPSGCTFWGTKPWSRKKKILWQLGLLIGAPLGIGLVAGVGVPAILIGFPIWVARRAMASYANKSACKRRGIVVSFVMVSILVAPFLAALAVGVGVPCMLLYVYGVVPFSICRNGCYGASSQNAAGASSSLRLDLGSPAVPSVSGVQNGYDTASLPGPAHLNGVRQAIANPSIGEASVGGLTMASYTESHASAADRNDVDGASTTAIAGTSITGSINGSTAATIEAANSRLKENDQIPEIGPNSAVTSVQVHMQDNVSVHSTSSYAPSTGSTISKSYSSKSLGAKRKSLKGKTTGSRKSLMPRKISEEGSKSLMDSRGSSKSSEAHSSDSSPDTHDVGSRMVYDARGKSVVVEMEKCGSSTITKLHRNDDTISMGSGSSSCGSHYAIVDQTSSNCSKVDAAILVKKDVITTVAITNECGANKKLKKQSKK